MNGYAARELERLHERGPALDEDFYRLKVTGNGETRWINITPTTLLRIAQLLEVCELAMMFEIYCDGTQSRGELVVDPNTMQPKRFATRREAREYRDSIEPDQPSKFLPLRVRQVKS